MKADKWIIGIIVFVVGFWAASSFMDAHSQTRVRTDEGRVVFQKYVAIQAKWESLKPVSDDALIKSETIGILKIDTETGETWYLHDEWHGKPDNITYREFGWKKIDTLQ